MKGIIVIAIICCLFSACDEEKDPFVHSWGYRPIVGVNPKTDTLVLTFDLNRSGNNYKVSDAKVNSQRWSDFNVENVALERKIGVMSFGTGMPAGNGTYEEIIMYNCLIAGNRISVDSVVVFYDNPKKKSVYKSQFITWN